MDKRTTGIIATLVTVLLCGCPGLFGLCMGGMFLIAGLVPGAEIDIFGSHEPATAIAYGAVGIIVSLIFVAIPVVVAIITLRKKKTSTPAKFNEPIPPAS